MCDTFLIRSMDYRKIQFALQEYFYELNVVKAGFNSLQLVVFFVLQVCIEFSQNYIKRFSCKIEALSPHATCIWQMILQRNVRHCAMNFIEVFYFFNGGFVYGGFFRFF